MNCLTAGAFPRHDLTTRRHGAPGASDPRSTRPLSLLSPLELRRLVAAMVD